MREAPLFKTATKKSEYQKKYYAEHREELKQKALEKQRLMTDEEKDRLAQKRREYSKKSYEKRQGKPGNAYSKIVFEKVKSELPSAPISSRERSIINGIEKKNSKTTRLEELRAEVDLEGNICALYDSGTKSNDIAKMLQISTSKVSRVLIANGRRKKGRGKYDITKTLEKEICKLRKQKLSTYDIAEKTGVGQSTVSIILIRNGMRSNFKRGSQPVEVENVVKPKRKYTKRKKQEKKSFWSKIFGM